MISFKAKMKVWRINLYTSRRGLTQTSTDLTAISIQCIQTVLRHIIHFSSTVTVPGGWQRSVTWHLLSLWPASTHHLRTTPWWSREDSRTAARTLYLSGLKLKVSTVKTAPQLIDFQQSSQRHLRANKKSSDWWLFFAATSWILMQCKAICIHKKNCIDYCSFCLILLSTRPVKFWTSSD